MTCAELKRMLKQQGCYLVSHGKRHDKWFSPISNQFVRLPRHDSLEIKTGTAQAILKDAGIK